MSKYNPERSSYWLNRYRDRMREGMEYLGGVCVECGSDEGLEFDHIDPTTKSFTLTVEWGRAKSVWWNELQKCQLLCKDCHLKKTVREQTINAHGTWSTYRKRKCRCEVCKTFMRDYMREYRARNRA